MGQAISTSALWGVKRVLPESYLESFESIGRIGLCSPRSRADDHVDRCGDVLGCPLWRFTCRYAPVGGNCKNHRIAGGDDAA